MQNSLFYITAPSMEVAEKIAENLVDKKLAACANIIPRLKSFFYWEGEVQSEEEVLVLGKTKTSLIPELEEEVKAIHPYEVPCFISWQIDAGHKPFMEWIAEETRNAVNKKDK